MDRFENLTKEFVALEADLPDFDRRWMGFIRRRAREPKPSENPTFEFPGPFHTPTVETPVKRLFTTPPAGTYRRIHFRLTVTHGGWSATSPDGRHNICWFVRDGNRDLFAYLNALGPGRNVIRLGHGIDIAHTEKPKKDKGFEMVPGETYTFDYVYDAEQRSIVLRVLDAAGAEALRMEDTPNVDSIAITAKSEVIWDFGFPGTSDKEPATLGWVYRDLFVEYVP
jgi:hypothetical protein